MEICCSTSDRVALSSHKSSLSLSSLESYKSLGCHTVYQANKSRKRPDEHGTLIEMSREPKISVGRHDNKNTPQKQRLLSLPAELHNLVFENLDIEDVLNLSRTCRYIWEIGQSHLQNYCMSTLGTWAGKNIVCVGDYHGGHREFPPHLFNKDQQQKFYDYKDDFGENNLFAFSSGHTSNRNLWIDDFEPLAPLLVQLIKSRDYSRL